jgi:septal ring-binding cell division protein DamX
MTKKYVLVLAIIVVGTIVAYSGYSHYQTGKSTESADNSSLSSGVSDSGTITTNTTDNTPVPNFQENDNQTNRSTVSIPLEKPPFIT